MKRTSNNQTLAQKLAEQRGTAPMNIYKVHVLVNPPMYLVKMGLAQADERRTIEIQGYSLQDAKNRAGIL